METVEFKICEDFEQPLADRFSEFMAGLSAPCMVALEIESYGGYCHVLGEMETLIAQKKAEGYVFLTNVEHFAYSCGLFLFLLGDIRMCSDKARFLYHEAGFYLCERVTSPDLQEMLALLQESDAMTEKIMSENTNVSPEFMAFLKKNESFLDREDMVNFGLMEEEYELI